MDGQVRGSPDRTFPQARGRLLRRSLRPAPWKRIRCPQIQKTQGRKEWKKAQEQRVENNQTNESDQGQCRINEDGELEGYCGSSGLGGSGVEFSMISEENDDYTKRTYKIESSYDFLEGASDDIHGQVKSMEAQDSQLNEKRKLNIPLIIVPQIRHQNINSKYYEKKKSLIKVLNNKNLYKNLINKIKLINDRKLRNSMVNSQKKIFSTKERKKIYYILKKCI